MVDSVGWYDNDRVVRGEIGVCLVSSLISDSALVASTRMQNIVCQTFKHIGH